MQSASQIVRLAGPLFFVGALFVSSAGAVEWAVLTADNWDEFAPQGKEVDCVLGDIVIRNDKIVAVIAQPLPTRNANMTVRGVGGQIIDLTEREKQNDQLSAYYAGAGRHSFTSPERIYVEVDGAGASPPAQAVRSGRTISVQMAAVDSPGKATPRVRYTLTEGAAHIEIETFLINANAEPVTEELGDSIRADRTFEFGDDSGANLFWASDEWFRQAYGVLPEGARIARGEGRAAPIQFLVDGKAEVVIPASMAYQFKRRLFPASNLLGLKSVAGQIHGAAGHEVSFSVSDPTGATPNAKIAVLRDGQPYADGRTDDQGALNCTLPAGEYAAKVTAQGSPDANVALSVAGPSEFSINLEAAGMVSGAIVGPDDGPVPCKVAFHATGGGVDPFFGPDSGDTAVHNLVYTPDGRFLQRILPGKYEVIVSYGPEFDAVFQTIDVTAGDTTTVSAKLTRTVDTTGWVSADFHSHASPSGDNTSSQLGRVQNLLAEHLEFAPCTEHNRITTYDPHLKAMKVEHLMATCPGMELTGNPLPINHQNAFPLIHRPGQQDGGAPQTDADPEVQIERLALWDNGSDKLVQENHPNIPQIFGDRDLDGQPDEGFAKMFGFMDVIEVHPPGGIFTPPMKGGPQEGDRNPICHWMQLINLGYRIPGVINTDAHYNFHGSSWHRNFIKSSTDDPAKIDIMEMVHESEKGHLVMSTGPFLELSASSAGAKAIPGDDLAATDKQIELSIRVQCANWLDVNRVQVFLNGRPSPELNFTRQTTPDRFTDGVVKFQAELPVSLAADTHVIVATIGEGLSLGRVLGPDFGKMPPCAVTNPIFVDIDGDGFKPNGDLLDIPLPVKKP